MSLLPARQGLRLGWRLLRRDLAAGEVRVLLAALALAVAAVTTVGFVTDRAQRALAAEANRLLGADAVLRGDAPIGEAPRALADELGLASTDTVSLRSMLQVDGRFTLGELRALGPGWPLRGSYRLAGADGSERVAEAIPEPGTLWLARAGAEQLDIAIGDSVQVGEQSFRLAALVLAEPDATLDYFNMAPRVFLNLADLPATGLLQEGSRAGFRLAVAGSPDAVQAFVARQGAALERGQRLETIADARPEIRNALQRADRFLGLAAMIAVVLAAIAVAMAARRHAARHLDACAVLRCLGASQRMVLAIYLGELALLGLGGVLLGVALGLLVQSGLGGWLEAALGMRIPAPGPLPALEGMAVGLAVLAAFALPPVLSLRRVSALRVLRRDLGAPAPAAWLVALLGLGALAGLLWWKAGSAVLGTAMLVGVAATLLALALLAALLVVVLRRLRGRLRGPWRYGLANVGRRALSSAVQIAALGLGLMAILLLTLVRTDLIARWQQALPEDAPNRFIVNVQQDQVDGVRALLAGHGVSDPVLFPMVRARLVAVNGEAVSGTDYDGRARRLAEREFNLSMTADLAREDNAIVAGAAWPASGADPGQLSVEEEFADALGWAVGDRIAFDISGRRFEGAITSLRQVDWESFRPNFFVVAPPGALDDYPASWITAVHAPEGSGLTGALVRAFPNLTVIDVDAVLAQVRSTAEQVATAIEYVFYFTLVAGLLVLVAAVTASQDERLLEGSVMRVLGASTRQLRLAQASEFAVVGLIAGLTAAVAAAIVSGVIATQAFDLPWEPDWRLALYGGAAGLVAVTITGLLATRRIVTASPNATLRLVQD